MEGGSEQHSQCLQQEPCLLLMLQTCRMKGMTFHMSLEYTAGRGLLKGGECKAEPEAAGSQGLRHAQSQSR